MGFRDIGSGEVENSERLPSDHTDADHHEENFKKPVGHHDEEHHGDDGNHIGHFNDELKSEIWFWTLTINGGFLVLFFTIAVLRRKQICCNYYYEMRRYEKAKETERPRMKF